MRQTPMVNMMVEVEPMLVAVLEEGADLPKYQDQLSVEDVAKKNSTFSRVNGKDM